jgi:succinylarginine dihydrolase
MQTYQEINFDGLVGPTHHYGGLSIDNLASESNRATLSNPKRAALQGLTKMKALKDMGYPQAVLPPLKRPHVGALHAFGFQHKKPSEALKAALDQDPLLLSAIASASSMWTANAATVAPSCDTVDGQLHLVSANLNSKLHRALEAPETAAFLQQIFGVDHAHPALPGGQAMGDEGAANHTRLAPSHASRGIHIFVYGRSTVQQAQEPHRFRGRQTLAASQAVARKLRLADDQLVFLHQNQTAIDAGVFHNDVIAVGNLDCYFSHELAYTDGSDARNAISSAFEKVTGKSMTHVVVPESEVTLETAVKTYLFNSQLIGPSGNMTLIAPIECQENESVSQYLTKLCEYSDSPIRRVHFFNLRESMRNGGGPACLRLRVVLNEEEKANLGARVILDDRLHEDLVNWVERHYRDHLTLQDIASAELLEQTNKAYSELAAIMELGSLYNPIC